MNASTKIIFYDKYDYEWVDAFKWSCIELF